MLALTINRERELADRLVAAVLADADDLAAVDVDLVPGDDRIAALGHGPLGNDDGLPVL